jgi:hypothetical protein
MKNLKVSSMWIVFVFGFLMLLGASLQHVGYFTPLPSFVLIISSVAILTIKEIREAKFNDNIFLALFSFILACIGLYFMVLSAPSGEWDNRIPIIFIISLLSLVFGLAFKIINTKIELKFAGNSLFLQGIILNTIPLFVSIVDKLKS